MSKYGKISVKVSEHFTSDQLDAFAQEQGISYDEAESLAHELLYRRKYNKMRNKDPQVRAKRKAYNKRRNALRSLLTQ